MLRQVIVSHALPIPKGKKNEETYVELMEILFNGEASSSDMTILNQMIQLPSQYLDELVNLKCGDIPIEEILLDSHFWKPFIAASKRNASKTLDTLLNLNSKTSKEVEKVFFHLSLFNAG